MSTPLYSGIAVPNSYRSQDMNTGLWFDKFCDRWQRDGRYWRLGDEKSAWIKTISGQAVGDSALLEEFVNRLGCMAMALQGEVRCFTTDWRFVTGIGRDHPVENGFVWHHVLGVPYLPGSSIKGVVRTWAEQWEKDKHPIGRIFGPSDGEKSAGSVIFFDALPLKPVKVQIDVMTPHYTLYYQQQGKSQPPGDWFAPVPIPFLTVTPDQLFLFVIAPRRPHHPDDRRDSKLVLEWLEAALQGIGAGAKTSVGYGRFTRRRDLEEKLVGRWPLLQPGDEPGKGETEAQPAVFFSDIRAEMEADGYSTDEEHFMLVLTTKWLEKIKDAETETAQKKEIAQLLTEWYQKNKPGQWKKPNKKNAKKIAVIKSVLGE